MKKFIIKSLCLISIIVCICFGYNKLYNYFLDMGLSGPSTEQQIITSFENAKKTDATTFVLGNSRMYRGINPDLLVDFNAYNFAHDNDSFNQMYYKLKWLLDNKKDVETLIVGIDYFQFGIFSDTRNYVYVPLFEKGYEEDYAKQDEEADKNSLITKINNTINDWKTKNGVQGLKFILKGIYKSIKNEEGIIDSGVPYLKENGQYIYYSSAREDDTVVRDMKINEVQKDYFKKIIELCVDNDINLFLVMPPVRDVELENYTPKEIEDFKNMILTSLPEEFKNHYIDCSNMKEFKDYRCYTDITHLNSKAADEFTIALNKLLKDN